MITNSGCCQLQGKKSRPCEDRYRLLGSDVPLVNQSDRGHIYAVMDGVSDAPKAIHAAQRVADGLLDFYTNPEIPATPQGLNDLLVQLSDEVYKWGFIQGTQRPLGAAALTVGWFSPDQLLTVLHAGDTLAVRFDGDRCQALTREHSDGRALHRYLGQGPAFRLDCTTIKFDEGDLLCLVTDGVTKVLSLDDIESILKEFGHASERAARELTQEARDRRSLDDITAVIVELEEW
jgi:serine/threonine protein phosphatase PrpC